MLREVLTVSALILAVLLVRAIFKNRVPKRMVYTLWLVVLVKLVISPLTYKSYVSMAKMRLIKPQVDELNKKYPKQELSLIHI